MTSLWNASRLANEVKTEQVQRFVVGVPVYRQRFSWWQDDRQRSGSAV